MAIKDKNGNILRLSHPNPIRMLMNEWDNAFVELINFDNHVDYSLKAIEEEIKPKIVVEKSKPFNGNDFNNLMNTSESIVEMEIPVKITSNNLETKDSDQLKRAKTILEKSGDRYHCAPVVKTPVTDELYGTTYYREKYGEPYVFNAMFVDSDDLSLTIWCLKELNIGSIILKITAGGGERWWKINNCVANKGGFLCNAIISDINPSF